jgi:hypothetical protein
MAQTGFTPIQLYFSSTTTNVPLAANLANGELAINITDGKLFYKDNASAVQVIGWKVVPATAGGTGQTSYAVGDLLYANTTTTLAKLPDVATGNALISGGVGVAPSWGKIGLTTHVSGVLPVANGGTNASAASITAFNNITGYTASGATGTTSTNLVFSTSPSITTPTLVGDVSVSTGNVVIGTSGKGIDFSATPGTGTSELFADYEEGTFTPTFTCGTPGNLSITYDTRTGTYTKIGRQVTVFINLAFSAFTHTTASGIVLISGLPFTPGVTSFAPTAAWGGFTSANFTQLGSQIVGTVSNVYLTKSGSGQPYTNISITDFPSGGTPSVYMTATYFV